ncbi:MAG: GNAT family N-acetyltransferase [Prolixibacteraceae bacterium]
MNHAMLSYGKVRLRSLEPEDLELLYLWENDPSIWKVSNTLVPFSRFILRQYIEESHRDIFETKQLRLIIESPEGKAAGAIDLFDFDPYHQRAGIGILIYDAGDRRNGLASDTLYLVCSYAENTLGLHQLYANIGVDNPGSRLLFEKAGFQVSGTKKDWLRTPDGWVDECIMQKIL